MKYIHYFETAAEFSQAESNVADSEPWVSYCERYSLLTYSPALDIEAVANGHGYVDLGLPSGTLWATMNIGASSETGYGNYYAWGEVSTKSSFSWNNYTWGTLSTQTKYNDQDSKYILDLEDDTANALWGNQWTMPTVEQCEELLQYCPFSWTTRNGVYGGLFTSSINSNELFFPAAGSFWESGATTGSAFGIWASEVQEYHQTAYGIWGDSTGTGVTQSFERAYGHTIRGVFKASRRWYNPLLL